VAELAAAVARVSPDGAAWLGAQLAAPLVPARFDAAFAAAGRRLGSEPVGAVNLAFAWPADSCADECGRAALVIAAASRERDVPIAALVRRGDARERSAVLRALAALPGPERYVDVAIDACRSNVTSVFIAIACDNDVPARYFPEAAFNQLVLKALFIGAPVARIVGLSARVTPELERMVAAFASERRAAGRDVPPDAALVRKATP
jgi:hypothetical protein